jgi:uncharacterized membrane protein HdeD (DUF308 family)
MRSGEARRMLKRFPTRRRSVVIIANPFNIASYEVQAVSRRWWVLLWIGLLSVVAGAIVLIADWNVVDLAVFVGALFVFRGFMTMFSVPVDGSGVGWSIALGLLEVGLGIMAWAWPGPTLLVIAYAIGWYVLFSGIFAIANSISGRHVLPYWGFMLAFGIFEVLLAVALLGNPGITLVATVFAIGLWCVIYGVVDIVLAFEVKRLGGDSAAAARDVDTLATSQDLTRAS